MKPRGVPELRRRAIMARWFKFLVGIFASVGLVVVMLAIRGLIPSSANRICTIYPVMSVSSPGGKMFAEQEQQICDNDPKVETYVWVFERDHPNKKWSAFSANSAQQVGESNVFQPLSLAIQWSDDTHLVVAFPRGTSVSSEERSEQGIKVSYAERANNR